MRKCPECGGQLFTAFAQVVQEWVLDGQGFCVDVADGFVDLIKAPGDNDTWECNNCGYIGKGIEFYIEDEEINEY